MKASRSIFCFSVLSITAMFLGISVVTGQAYGFSPEMRRASLRGPWEVSLKISKDNRELSFPVSVADDSKVTELDNIYPVMGTPLKIRLKQYLPDLKWRTFAEKSPKGGCVVKLNIKGAGLDQEMWLNSNNPDRKSISSEVGGIRVIELRNPEIAEKIISTTGSDAVGIIKVWYPDPNKPLEFMVSPGRSIKLPDTENELRIIKYVHRYSVDTATREVTDLPDTPVNPAIKIGYFDGKTHHEQWLWSRQALPPHSMKKVPFRVTFEDFNVLGAKGQHVLVGLNGGERRLLYEKDGKRHVEKVKLNHPYVFADKNYSFTIEEVVDNSVVKNEWYNNSEELAGPALIAVFEYDDKETQLVLEFNKHNYFSSEYGMIILHYRQQADALKMSKMQ